MLKIIDDSAILFNKRCTRWLSNSRIKSMTIFFPVWFNFGWIALFLTMNSQDYKKENMKLEKVVVMLRWAESFRKAFYTFLLPP